jgi:adhesin HecA-like repeat protein
MVVTSTGKSLSEVSTREAAFLDALTAGCVVECSTLSPEQLATLDNPRYTVRAELLRDLILRRNGECLDPLGVRVHGARITGTLDLTHVPATVGVELRGCFFEHPLLLVGARLPWLALAGSQLPALDADGLVVNGDLLLGEGFTVAGRGEHAAVRLLGAHITGQLNINGARLTNEAGPALIADGIHVDGDLFGGGFVATGHGELGAVRLPGAHIIGQLNLNGAELANQAGPALVSDGLHAGGGLVLAEGFTATGNCERGAVRLPGGHIGGQLNLDGATLINSAGPALIADHLRVDGGVFLDGFTATGHGEDGAVRLTDAHISGQLNLNHATLTNQAGRALIADHLHVDSDMFAEGLTATGHTQDGAVRLPDAHISGQLNLNHATLANPAGPVLELADAEAKHLFLPACVICPEAASGTSACTTPTHRLTLGGLRYTTLHAADSREWLHLVIHHTRDYRPQPYQQLATVLRARGQFSAAREVLIAQQRDLYRRGDLGGWLARRAHWLWGVLAGYGYRSARVLTAVLLVLGVAGGLGVAAGHTPLGPGQFVATRSAQTAAAHPACSLVEQIGAGIDRSLPVAATGIGERCTLDTSSTAGQAFTAASWVLQALLWVLAGVALSSSLTRFRRFSASG